MPGSLTTYPVFTYERRSVFDDNAGGLDLSRWPFLLRQGSRCVADYAVEFRTLVVDANWNEPALRAAFHNGLEDAVKDELAVRRVTRFLSEFMGMTISLDNRLWERQREKGIHSGGGATRCVINLSVCSLAPPGTTVEEPMQLWRAWLTPSKRGHGWRMLAFSQVI